MHYLQEAIINKVAKLSTSTCSKLVLPVFFVMRRWHFNLLSCFVSLLLKDAGCGPMHLYIQIRMYNTYAHIHMVTCALARVFVCAHYACSGAERQKPCTNIARGNGSDLAGNDPSISDRAINMLSHNLPDSM